MKKSSKNRLLPFHQDLFTGSTLFDKIARAVCRAGVLPRKELFETWEMAKRVRRKFRGGRVLDLACGHGLLAHIMLILDNTSETALAVDRTIPKSTEKLSKALVERWPRLENRIVYQSALIEQIDVQPGDVVVSAHACGALTDRILDRAMHQHARVAVLPCCHDAAACQTHGLEGWMDKALAIDAARVFLLESGGYRVMTKKIPGEITPKNRLLMGVFSGK